MVSIEISITRQTLTLLDKGSTIRQYSISSAKNGIGSKEGSYCTPIGNFIISEKHGHHAPLFTVFKGRKPSDLWSPEQHCDDDLITTRILWLHGVDDHNANTKERYIYIHGTNHELKLGSPHSYGCIRMNNQDIVELFERVTEDTPVTITP